MCLRMGVGLVFLFWVIFFVYSLLSYRTLLSSVVGESRRFLSNSLMFSMSIIGVSVSAGERMAYEELALIYLAAKLSLLAVVKARLLFVLGASVARMVAFCFYGCCSVAQWRYQEKEFQCLACLSRLSAQKVAVSKLTSLTSHSQHLDTAI